MVGGLSVVNKCGRFWPSGCRQGAQHGGDFQGGVWTTAGQSCRPVRNGNLVRNCARSTEYLSFHVHYLPTFIHWCRLCRWRYCVSWLSQGPIQSSVWERSMTPRRCWIADNLSAEWPSVGTGGVTPRVSNQTSSSSHPIEQLNSERPPMRVERVRLPHTVRVQLIASPPSRPAGVGDFAVAFHFCRSPGQRRQCPTSASQRGAHKAAILSLHSFFFSRKLSLSSTCHLPHLCRTACVQFAMTCRVSFRQAEQESHGDLAWW